MSLTGFYGGADENEAIATIQRAIELGITHFDTAEVYGPYSNEELLGRAIKGHRHQLSIATKFGWRIVDGKTAGTDSRPETIRRVVDESLARLDTDYIDLLYQHRVDRAVPIEDVVGTMSELVQAGKVKYLGLSEASASTIARAHAVHPISALQSEYSFWERGIEESVLPKLRELGIGLVAFAPLGRGFLTGVAKRASDHSADDWRRADPRLEEQNFERNLAIIQPILEIAAARGAQPAQIALAWLLQRGEDIATIPGTKRRSYLEQNSAAAAIVLSSAELDRLAQSVPVSGERYGERQMQYVDR